MTDTVSYANLIFYVIFLGQIFLVSYFIPKNILRRIRSVYKNFPPKEFPKLYPSPDSYYQNKQHYYWIVNKIILISSLIVFTLGAIFYNAEMARLFNWNNHTFVTFFFVFQYSPLILILGKAECKQFKSMREANKAKQKKAVLTPRNLSDYVSPRFIYFAIAVYFAFIAFVIYFDQLGYSWFAGYWNILGITFLNAVYIAGIYWHLHGKKLDPYQANEDRSRSIKVITNLLVFMSIATTLSIVIHVVLKAWDFNIIKLIFNSLYSQAIAWVSIISLLHSLRIEDINYNVYKADDSSTPA